MPVPKYLDHWRVTLRAEIDGDGSAALRVMVVDDLVPLRAAIAASLTALGFDVVLEASDAIGIEDLVNSANPQVVLMDIRMPPTFTTEGLDATERIKRVRPDIGVLLLSAEVHLGAAAHLAADTGGVGYLLKDHIADLDELSRAVRTVAGGGSAIDRDLLAQLGLAEG